MIRAATPADIDRLAALSSARIFLRNHFLVLILGGPTVASFLAWQRVAIDELEILQLQTLGPFRRRGFARRLLRHLKQHEPGDMFLEVRPSNAPARQLYHSEGFTEVGLRRSYYSDPPEDGIVLKFRSC